MLDIAVGKGRNQKIWRNKRITWEDLAQRLSETQHTHETFKEYLKADKQRQAEIKDVGGFVGGYLNQGRRTPVTQIKHRQILTLDLDNATNEFWFDFTLEFSCAAVVYSTHKHSPEEPRLRLVIPFDRPLSIEEYEAAGRKVAELLGMDLFDPTTFQPQRLMYWPSTSKDGEFYYKRQEGDPMEADSILSLYKDWKDVSEWPLHTSDKELLKKDIKQQEDPRSKEGIIGAFCRLYSISEAIDEFLSEEYEDLGGGRYTYRLGSTSAGAICYDDTFLYSHHGTDPIQGQLCNAFDLVRIHKFGHNDQDKGVPLGKKESQRLMLEFAGQIPGVIREIGVFNDLPDGEWLGQLEIVKTGKNIGEYADTIENILLILRNDPALKGAFKLNLFDHMEYAQRALPWNAYGEVRPMTDKDDAGLRHYIEKNYGLFHVNKTKDALDLAGLENSCHPVKEYLDSLEWDGVQRIETVFIDGLGVEDTAFVRAATRKALVASVARIYKPGIKFDYSICLVGDQGLRKSMMIDELGGQWYSDSLDTMQGKEAYEQLQGAWLIEIAELSAMKKQDVETAKKFITKRKDRYRVAYGRRVQDFPRQCTLWGTSNEWNFIIDTTGGRRFWPLHARKRYVQGSMNVDQIWAEAKYAFEQGEYLYLDETLEAEAAEVQALHTAQDERQGVIENYLNLPLPPNWPKMGRAERRSYVSGNYYQTPEVLVRNKVCVAEIWVEVLGGDITQMNSNNTKFIHMIMAKIKGWERCGHKSFGTYGSQRGYIRKGTNGEYGKITGEKIQAESE